MNKKINIIVISAVVGAIVASLVSISIQNTHKTDQDLIKEFYAAENAVSVSPHGLRKKMSRGEIDGYVLVDLRSDEEYEKEHIITSVNIPAYRDPNNSAYDEVDRIVGSFKELIENNPGKEIITYCYSIPCMTSRKIGKMLSGHGIYVKHLNVGWNEWRYYWDLWNHDSEEPSNVFDYVVSGNKPGVPKVEELPSPCGEGEFGC